MKRDLERIKRVISDAVVILLKSAALGIFLLFFLMYFVRTGYTM